VSRPRIHQLVRAVALLGHRSAGRLFIRRSSLDSYAEARGRRRRPPPYTLDDLRRCRDRILELAKARGAGNVRVFGSAVSGQVDRYSDVDLAVDMEPGRRTSDIAALAFELEEALGCRVDLLVVRDDLRDRRPLPSIAAIIEGAVPL
jgi:predicted nucleotidyltransferase